MTPEKQIEEMEIALREAIHEFDDAWRECLHNDGKQPRRETLFYAKYLVENKGYRKVHDNYAIQCVCYALGCQAAEKIKTEVASEIFAEIEKLLIIDNFRLICNRIDFAELKKKYTEVEE